MEKNDLFLGDLISRELILKFGYIDVGLNGGEQN